MGDLVRADRFECRYGQAKSRFSSPFAALHFAEMPGEPG